MGVNLPIPADVRVALERVRSLHEGDRGVLDAIACGSRAVPALGALLFARESSGLYQPRLRAIQALAALGAQETLIDFLSAPHEAADPVERLGEETVVSAAARALGDTREERVFELLLRLADVWLLPGVVAALGRSGRAKALPYLVDALAEDCSRPDAESALKSFGAVARPALLAAAAWAPPPGERETESGLRQRQSALRLLREIGASPEDWLVLRHLTVHPDARVAALACEIALVSAPDVEKPEAARRLKRL